MSDNTITLSSIVLDSESGSFVFIYPLLKGMFTIHRLIPNVSLSPGVCEAGLFYSQTFTLIPDDW